MKIAIFVDDYLPESTKVAAKMISDLAREYLVQGHNVTVFVPSSKIKQGKVESIIDGVNVVFFKNGEVKHPNKIKRAINEFTLSYTAWFRLKVFFKANPQDLIIYYSPSIFFGELVRRLKVLWQCDSYLILRDIFPSWAVEQGHIKEGSIIHRFFSFFEIKNYEAASVIGLQSNKNKEMFDSRFLGKYKTECLYNWAELVEPLPSNNNIRDIYNLHDKIIYFYGGNMGTAQDMMNLVRLAHSMKKYENAFFLFVGAGDEVLMMQNSINELGLTNALILPSVNQVEFLEILSACDIGMFTLSQNHTSHNFPGKILAYIQQNKAVLGSVNQGNDIIDLFDKYSGGYLTVNGDDDILLKNAIKLLELNNRILVVKNASAILKNEFSVRTAALKIASIR
ncbi:glycosyltransferase WbuB [Psychrosphaera saromensis]|uniref:Glycosyl transferase family 1 domain-containing protein n=1 Tax=Psychrosphaera saromensis TaxID=716813 RepID=A0A2S7UY98_9GAMM|nr:glycosyltransferase family 4 protein [Psychrosphaera saromensis]PQJ54749.1 hypothetical protein BTO11_14555 [Psychrosphaera saromensis]GHB57459.1 glycosyltransferase WbuB [Psychrosphaera saromensis]GLQ14017.1 glycosyltransferase WbuB [Psychrosphaera saromensis]